MQLTTTNQRGFAPTTLTEAIQFSEMLASSSMVPRAYQGKPNDVLVCLQWGYEMGMAPMQALQNIAVINGKPSMYGDSLIALVQASPACEDIEEYFENEGTPNPVAVCVARRKGRTPVIFKFSVEDAKRAGLWGKTGPWQAYPKRMMQMRARGFALRDAFPDVLTGLITAEEAHDWPAEAKGAPAPHKAPANPLDMVAKPVELAAPAEPEVLDPVAEVAEVVEVVEHVELQPLVERVPGEDDDLGEVEPIGFAVRVPGKEQPYSVHDTLEEWADAYEELAEKTAKAGKRPARERMTILKELKECNQETIGRIDTMKRIRHTANYQKRINALGAAQ
jgi:hypothetical protein